MVVAVRSGQAFERFAAINGTIQTGICDVDLVGILGVGPNVSEIPCALAETVIVGDKSPVFAAIIAAEEAAFFASMSA